MVETILRNALALFGGDLSILFQSAISNTLWVMAVPIVLLPRWLFVARERQGCVTAATMP